MADRLDPLDAAALYLEEERAPQHVGGVYIFKETDAGIDYDRLVALIARRIAMAPRHRQRIKLVPGNIGAPVWVDDTNFDVTYHVRRSALPRPGTDEQLAELVARIMARPLDRDRPLWEVYLVEGLTDRRFAILTKSHHALVDGLTSMDISQIILDEEPLTEIDADPFWRPSREPSSAELLVSAAVEQVQSPAAMFGHVRKGVSDVTDAVSGLGRGLFTMMTAAISVARTPASSPLNFDVSEARRIAWVDMDLAELKKVRTAHGGTINDVILTVVSGAMRHWLQSRGVELHTGSEMTALVPVSVELSAAEAQQAPGGVEPFLVPLPVGEQDPLIRLSRISYEMVQHRASRRLVGAENLATIAGFAPPTLHALGTRLGADISERTYNLVVTNVPGPQLPLFVAGAEMIAAYPILALTKGHGLSIGVTSYHGRVFFGLNADRDGVADLPGLAAALKLSADELVERSSTRPRRKRTPKSS